MIARFQGGPIARARMYYREAPAEIRSGFWLSGGYYVRGSAFFGTSDIEYHWRRNPLGALHLVRSLARNLRHYGEGTP